MKILFLDIEIAPAVGYTWGPKFDTNIIEFIEPWYVISVAWKWLGGKKRVVALDDHTEKGLLEEVHQALSECDIAVAHNGDKFDFKKLNTRFLHFGMKPPRPFRTFDTRKFARQRFGFYSNSLNDLAQSLGIGQKMSHEGFSLWKKCMDGDLAALRTMKAYNMRDVELLEKIYLRFSPWIQRVFSVSGHRCPRPNCGSSNVQSRGKARSLTAEYDRFQCKECGGWSRAVSGNRVGDMISI